MENTFKTKIKKKKPRGNKCVYFNCGKSKYNGGANIRVFRFPFKNPELCKKWIFNCGNLSLVNLPTDALRHKIICGNHFLDSDFKTDKKKKFKDGTVPIPFNPFNERHTPPPREICLSKESTFSSTSIVEEFPEGSTDVTETLIRSTSSSREKILQSKIVKHTKTIKNLRRRLDKIKQAQKYFRQRVAFKSNLESMFLSFCLTFAAKTLIRIQFRIKQSPWGKAEKKFAMSLYKKSPKAYRYLRSIGIMLPDISVVRGSIGQIG